MTFKGSVPEIAKTLSEVLNISDLDTTPSSGLFLDQLQDTDTLDVDSLVLQLDEVERQNVLDDGLFDPPVVKETSYLAKYELTNFTSVVEVSKEVLYISLTNVDGLVPSTIYILDPEAEVGNLADWGAGSVVLKNLMDASTQTDPIPEPSMPSTSFLNSPFKDQVVQTSNSPPKLYHGKFPAQYSRNFWSSARAARTPPPQQSSVVVVDHDYSKIGDRPILDSCVLCLAKGHKSAACPERRRTDILKCWRCGLQGVTMKSCPDCGPGWKKKFLYKRRATLNGLIKGRKLDH